MTRDLLSVVPAGPEHGAALAGLFERAGVACHCRYWHFQGNTNAWLARCAHSPDENRGELSSALACGSDEALGVVALEGTAAIGWMKLSPALAVPKIYGQRLYARLPCFDGPREGVMSIGCVLVDPSRRRNGVSRALLDAALRLAKSRGATAVEAFPRRADGLRDDEAWASPFSLLAAAGFEVVNDFGPYPVVRRRL